MLRRSILTYFVHFIDDHFDVKRKQVNSCVVRWLFAVIVKYQYLSSSLKLMAGPVQTRWEFDHYYGNLFSWADHQRGKPLLRIKGKFSLRTVYYMVNFMHRRTSAKLLCKIHHLSANNKSVIHQSTHHLKVYYSTIPWTTWILFWEQTILKGQINF